MRQQNSAGAIDVIGDEGEVKDGNDEDRRYVDDPKDLYEYLSSSGISISTRGSINIKPLIKDANSNLDPTIDDIMSKELLGMSIVDRENLVEEMHGVQTLAPVESPGMLQAALDELQLEIDRIPATQRKAYSMSQEHSNGAAEAYINSAEFRLRFLRCDLFDSKAAASRMVKFLDLLVEVFGEYALRRPIQITDFSRDEMRPFRLGLQQLLPYRDRSGRRIYASVGGFGVTLPLRIRVKILIYLLYAASDDVETQRMGITSVVWPGGQGIDNQSNSQPAVDKILFMKRVFESLPVRTCSIHFCLPDQPFYQVIKRLLVLQMPSYRKRMKFHVGQNIELQYTLKGFGIPIELIPLTDTGNVKTSYLKQWIKLRKLLEVMIETEAKNNSCYGSDVGGEGLFNDDTSINTMGSSVMSVPYNQMKSIIECPRSHDVVFRSGTSMSCHPGNVRFRCLIELKHDTKTNISSSNGGGNNDINIASSTIVSKRSKVTQAELAEQVIDEIETNGGRFLKWDNKGYWTKIQDRTQVHTKVSLSIRDYKYKARAQRNQQSNSSYTYIFRGQDGNKRMKTNK